MARDDFRGEFHNILLKEGIVSQDTLNAALREQDRTKQPFLDVLLSGKIDEKKMMTALAQFYGYNCVNPAVFLVDPEILALIPQKIAEKHTLLPISIFENTLTVAFANPTNLKAIDEVRALTGKRIKCVIAEAGNIKKCIEKYYKLHPSQGAAGDDSSVSAQNIDDIVRMIDINDSAHSQEQTSDLLKVAYETPVIKIVNMILAEGIRRKASDIFVEPWENFVRVRIRVDGLLEEIVRPHKSMGPAMVSRIKVMSDLDIAERRIPQDGRFKIKMTGREVDMRVSILPTSFGEKICLRILDTTSQGHDLTKLGFNEDELTIIRDSARRPHGMILVTGPTGSGKTTTLYSVLKYLDKPDVNITTVEDPVEYQLPGINQVNVKEHIGLTFPAALRSILRQDPDIILIGEIRDNATLDIAVKAALTGHLVLSTLHTNDAASSVTRMMNMGLEPFLIASTVLMISAQRLVRRICPRCKTAEEVDVKVLKLLGLKSDKPMTFYRGKGCASCRQLGYSGRTVITEILPMAAEIRQAVLQGQNAEKIKSLAHGMGMSTLRQCALRKAIAGETTLEEVFRVTGEDQAIRKHAEELEKEGA